MRREDPVPMVRREPEFPLGDPLALKPTVLDVDDPALRFDFDSAAIVAFARALSRRRRVSALLNTASITASAAAECCSTAGSAELGSSGSAISRLPCAVKAAAAIACHPIRERALPFERLGCSPLRMSSPPCCCSVSFASPSSSNSSMGGLGPGPCSVYGLIW